MAGGDDPDDARQIWDDAADSWDYFVGTGLDFFRTEFHGPALRDACGEVRGLDVLDLGSGQGYFCRELGRLGARVTGIEWAPKLVAHARRHEQAEPFGVTYEVLDAITIAEHFAPASFDLITGCMSLMDMPRPGAVLAACHTLLRPGARIVASITHPVTDTTHRKWRRDANGNKGALEIDGYFEAATSKTKFNPARLPPERHFDTIQYRHTVEDWSAMIEAAGLVITRMREPRPTAEAITRQPDLRYALRVPYFLIFELRSAS